MQVKKIEHIGVAVKNLDESIKFYENLLGLICYKMEEVPDQRVKTAFFKIGDVKLELLEATDADSPVHKFIEKNGEGFHHIAFQVDDVNKSLGEAHDNGIRLIDEKSRRGAEGLHIGFLHPKSTHGILMEICGKGEQK